MNGPTDTKGTSGTLPNRQLTNQNTNDGFDDVLRGPTDLTVITVNADTILR
jgi:hypothetical protein